MRKIQGLNFHSEQSAYYYAFFPRSETAASLKKARIFSTPSGSSKVAGSSGSTPLPKLKSFAAALAEKGVTMETALEKVGNGSPSKQQYLANLNGFRVS
jgi:hypothetical protein